MSNIGKGTAGQLVQAVGTSGNANYTTATYPSIAGTAGKILISDGTNIVSSTPTYPNTSGSVGKILKSDGTNNVYSTATYPDTATGTGKILRADGTNWAASTATYPDTSGTSGNVLTSDGTNWTSSQPPMVLIQQQSASSVASVTFININTASYLVYLLTFRSVIPATDGATLRMQMSADNGSNWTSSGYLSGINTAPYNSTTWTNTNSTADFILTGPLDNGNANSTAHGWVKIFIVPANLGHIAGNVTQYDNTAATVTMGLITGRGGANGMNAFKLLMSTGNITNGKFSLYALAGN